MTVCVPACARARARTSVCTRARARVHVRNDGGPSMLRKRRMLEARKGNGNVFLDVIANYLIARPFQLSVKRIV